MKTNVINRESSLEEIKETSKEIVENIIQTATSASTEKLTAAAKIEETPTSSPVAAQDQKWEKFFCLPDIVYNWIGDRL